MHTPEEVKPFSPEDYSELTKLLLDISNDASDLHKALLSETGDKVSQSVLQATFIVAAWGAGQRAYKKCLDKFERGEEFEPQDELLTQFILFKEKEIKDYDKVFSIS